jgi:hypothetical protein
MATGFYVMSRLTVGTLNIWFVFLFPHFRLFHAWNAVTCIVPVALWIGALWVEYELAVVLQWMSFLFGIFSSVPDLTARLVPVLSLVSWVFYVRSDYRKQKILYCAVNGSTGILSRGRYGTENRENQ